MCKAIEEMMNDSKMEGKAEALVSLVKDGLLSIKDAAARLGMSEAEFQNTMNKLA